MESKNDDKNLKNNNFDMEKKDQNDNESSGLTKILINKNYKNFENINSLGNNINNNICMNNNFPNNQSNNNNSIQNNINNNHMNNNTSQANEHNITDIVLQNIVFNKQKIEPETNISFSNSNFSNNNNVNYNMNNNCNYNFSDINNINPNNSNNIMQVNNFNNNMNYNMNNNNMNYNVNNNMNMRNNNMINHTNNNTNMNNNMNYNLNNNINNNMNNNINLNNNGYNNGNWFNNPMGNNLNKNPNQIHNYQNMNNMSCFPINNNNYNNINFNNNCMNPMTFNNNVINMNNNQNNINQNLINFNNNQIFPFNNMQLPNNNNNFFNNNIQAFNPANFNFNNNYLVQNMQNIIFQQMFYKFLFQQYILNFYMNLNKFQSPNQSMPQFENVPEFKSSINENQELIKDLLEILREPKIKAKNDEEIIQQFSSPELLSNDLTTEIMTEFLSLDPDLLNGFGNKFDGKWARREKRGGFDYIPPIGWVGFGLNVINKYDNKNNDWLACDGRPGEWCVGYHGIGRNQSSDEVRNMIKSILKINLQPGKAQAFKNDIDIKHKGKKVGIGVYISYSISVLEQYSGIINIRGKKYKVGIMVRCKPDKIRVPRKQQNYWVLDGNFDQLRPYRLLIRELRN